MVNVNFHFFRLKLMNKMNKFLVIFESKWLVLHAKRKAIFIFYQGQFFNPRLLFYFCTNAKLQSYSAPFRFAV